MRGSRRIVAMLAAAFVAAACADLDVENLNSPDRERALATPGDVETLIAGSYYTWWYTEMHFRSTGQAASVIADEHSSSWGNACMRECSQEPRDWAYNNDPSYNYAYVNEYSWSRSYRSLSAIRDGLISIAGADGELGTADDMQIGDGGADNHRIITFGKFVQGLDLYRLALTYDQAIVLTEHTDFTQPLERVGYSEVADSAVAAFDEAIALAGQGTFSIPFSWVGTSQIDQDYLKELAYTYSARVLAYTPRTVAERAAVDWNEVLTRVDNGITENLVVDADDDLWYAYWVYYAQDPGWGRTHLRMLGPADQAGSWDAWEKETAGLRMPFMIDADDLRFPTYPPTAQDEAVLQACWHQPRSDICGGDGYFMKMEYRDPELPFRPERGTYHFSGYAAFPQRETTDDWQGPYVIINMAELDMLKAEAYIRLSQPGNAYPLINTYRAYGGLAPVTSTGAVPYDDAPTNTRCTPRMIDPFPSGTWQCGDLMEAMKYEKRMETYITSAGIPWYDDRGWGDLIEGSITMFPVPGNELLVLLEEIYTFGGDCTQVGSAPCTPDVVSWNDGGLKPLQLGDVPSAEDIRARAELFDRWNAFDRADRGKNLMRR
jgi:hypothetical protein